MRTIYRSFMLIVTLVATVAVGLAQEDASLAVKKNTGATVVAPKPVAQAANGLDPSMQAKPANARVNSRPAVMPRTDVDATTGEKVTVTTAPARPATKPVTATPRTVTPRTTFTEGSLKGKTFYTPSGVQPSTDPARVAAEKAKTEARKKAHPVHVTNTTAAEKATYPARRAAELKAKSK